jgi:hypothetical protein
MIDTLIDTYIAKTYDFFRKNIIIMSAFMYRDVATIYQNIHRISFIGSSFIWCLTDMTSKYVNECLDFLFTYS